MVHYFFRYRPSKLEGSVTFHIRSLMEEAYLGGIKNHVRTRQS